MTGAVPAHDFPALIRGLARGGVAHPVWRNDLGGTTYRVDARGTSCFVKWQPPEAGVSLKCEYDKLVWAGNFARVPTPLKIGSEDGCTYLITAAIAGVSAVDHHWTTRPEVAVPAVGRGLRTLHDALPVPDCPWTWSTESRVDAARSRGMALTPALDHPPPTDALVVCHGDACCPNTLLVDNGEFVAHVDLGALGVADRWADIAVAAMSTRWNYGDGWEDTLVRSYGIDPDEERMSFYRDLWNAT